MRLLLAAIVLTIFTLSAIGTASACYGSTCNNLDPVTAGCNSTGYTVGSNYVGSGTYQVRNDNRYSTACAANWGRVTSTSGVSRYIKSYVYNGSNGSMYPRGFSAGTQFYTDMIDGTVEACTEGAVDTDNTTVPVPYELETAQLCF